MDVTPAQDAAATRIQARVRGLQSRKQQRRAVVGVTKLQALQRGRFSRREYTRLLEFSREQDAFLLATKRRQLRIWRNEQELHFLQHTTAAQLEKIRNFQRRRGANLIQRTWRASRPATADDNKSQNLKYQRPRDRIFAFDPFQLGSREALTAESSTGFLRYEKRGEIGSRLEPQRLEKDLLGPLPSAQRGSSSVVLGRDKFQQRRRDLQDRIKQRVQVQVQKDKLKALHSSLSSSQQGQATTSSHNQLQDLLSPTRRQANRRRELYDQLVHLRRTTAKRVHEFETQYRSARASCELLSMNLAASCENRLRLLQQQQQQQQGDLSTTLPNLDKATRSHDPNQFQEQTARFQAETQQWDLERQTQAWQSHSRVVQAIQKKQKWWQTSIAGTEKDIRKVYANSPWENERKVWMWASCHDEDTKRSEISQSLEQQGPSHASDIDAFLFSFNRSENQADDQREDAQNKCPPPVDDREASQWWRTHCMQPHLVVASSSENDQHEANNSNNNNDEDEFHHRLWSSEALANPTFHRLCLKSQLRSRAKEHKLAVNSLTDRFQKHVNQRVSEIEMQIEVNTQLQQDIMLRRQQIKKRRTREENAVVSIQRVFRGLQGRKEALQVRAEFFVMVRGRAIRKGKCEECGEQQAVLECNECEESLHFCPQCWVQVHATRRRRVHVAIPMSVTLVTVSRRVGVAEAEVPKEGYRAKAPQTISTAVAAATKKSQTQQELLNEGSQTSGAKPAEVEIPRVRAAGKPLGLKAKAAALASSAKNEASSATLPIERRKPAAASKKAGPASLIALATTGEGTQFDYPSGGGGDTSCPPPAEEDRDMESEPWPSSVMVLSNGEESSKPPTLSAKNPKPSARTTLMNPASKIANSAPPRLSLKQQRQEGVVTTKSEVIGGDVGSGEPSTTAVVSDAVSSDKAEIESARVAPLAISTLTAQVDAVEPLDSFVSQAPESITTHKHEAAATTEPKAPGHATSKRKLPTEGQKKKTEETIETNLPADHPSEADASHESVQVKNEEVRTVAQPVKAKPASRLSLKQRMGSTSSSSPSVPNEVASPIQRSETALISETSESLSVDDSPGGGVIAVSIPIATSFKSAPRMGDANRSAETARGTQAPEASMPSQASETQIAMAEDSSAVIETVNQRQDDAAAATEDRKPSHDDKQELEMKVPAVSHQTEVPPSLVETLGSSPPPTAAAAVDPGDTNTED